MSSKPDPFTQLIRTGRAATYTLIALIGACGLLAWITKSTIFIEGMTFSGNWAHPWTCLTFPFASRGDSNGLVGVLLLLFWLYSLGAFIERELGSARVIALFLVATLIGAVAVYLAWLLSPVRNPFLFGPIIPIGALTAAWAVREPNISMRLWGILPVTSLWLAIIFSAFIPFVAGNGSLVAGAFALVPVGLAALYAKDLLPGLAVNRSRSKTSRAAKATERRDDSYYDDVFRRAKEREERERLRKLFESSLDDDK